MRIESDEEVSRDKGGHIREVVHRVEAEAEAPSRFDLIQLAVLPNLQQTCCSEGGSQSHLAGFQRC